MQDERKRNLRPSLSTRKDAVIAIIRFHIWRMPLMRSCVVLSVIPMASKTYKNIIRWLSCRNAQYVNLVKIIWDQAIARPLWKEGDSDNNPHAFTVTRRGDKWFPTNILDDSTIKINGRLDFFEFILNEGILSTGRNSASFSSLNNNSSKERVLTRSHQHDNTQECAELGHRDLSIRASAEILAQTSREQLG